MWRQTGFELRALADAFAASPGRVRVRQRAEQVDVSNLDREKFWALLKGLFEVKELNFFNTLYLNTGPKKVSFFWNLKKGKIRKCDFSFLNNASK